MTVRPEYPIAAELVDVHKSDPVSGTRILGGVTLRAMRRQVLLVTGPSGSGKSTALRVLAGIETPDSGKARILGQDLNDGLSARRRGRFIARNVGIGYQSHNLDTNLTVFSNLVGLAESTGQYDDEAEERVDRIVHRLGLRGRLDQPAGTLSGGQKMKVSLGRLLVPKRGVLLLDEPTGAIDPHGKADIFEFLKEMQEEDGSTIVMVSHDKEACDYADREVVIESGEVVAENSLRPAA